MPSPVQIPLSASGDATQFAAALEQHRLAMAAHRVGPAGQPAPMAHPLLESLIRSVPQGDPLPDRFEIIPYEIVDDTPRSQEQQQALQVLRETLLIGKDS